MARSSLEEDNMLAITTDGRKAALDFRLVAPHAAFDEEGKIGACVREVLDIWQRTASFRGAQIVFCDLSSPKGGKSFSVYDDLRDRLIVGGIPEKEIAFIHDADTDAQKATLFKAVREGRVRVLLGSTAKMGIGTNVQTRLSRCITSMRRGGPATSSSAKGASCARARRAMRWRFSAMSRKAVLTPICGRPWRPRPRFIAQVMKGDQGIRSLEDVELATLSYAEVKALASGNPMVIEKAGVDAEVASSRRCSRCGAISATPTRVKSGVCP